MPRSQHHDDVRRCGLVQLETRPAVVAPAGKIDDLGALGCRLGGLDRLHNVEPVLVEEERVFAEQVVELCDHGMFVGNNARFELRQGQQRAARQTMRNLSVTCLRDPSNPHGAGAFRLSIRSVASLLEVGKLSAIEVKHEKPKGG